MLAKIYPYRHPGVLDLKLTTEDVFFSPMREIYVLAKVVGREHEHASLLVVRRSRCLIFQAQIPVLRVQ